MFWWCIVIETGIVQGLVSLFCHSTILSFITYGEVYCTSNTKDENTLCTHMHTCVVQECCALRQTQVYTHIIQSGHYWLLILSPKLKKILDLFMQLRDHSYCAFSYSFIVYPFIYSSFPFTHVTYKLIFFVLSKIMKLLNLENSLIREKENMNYPRLVYHCYNMYSEDINDIREYTYMKHWP